ncbi:MAG: hypothetical protein ACRD22_22125, partial [Terriglobia bacterium]
MKKISSSPQSPMTEPCNRASCRYAIIAGNGHFPFLVLQAARSLGIEPVVIAIQEEASPALSERARVIHWLS